MLDIIQGVITAMGEYPIFHPPYSGYLLLSLIVIAFMYYMIAPQLPTYLGGDPPPQFVGPPVPPEIITIVSDEHYSSVYNGVDLNEMPPASEGDIVRMKWLKEKGVKRTRHQAAIIVAYDSIFPKSVQQEK